MRWRPVADMTGPSTYRDVDGRRIPISNPDKVLFPEVGVTKGELVDHYEFCAALILAQIRGRPLTLLRYPDGIGTEGWFQKHAPAHLPSWISSASIGERGGVEHIVAADAATLVYLANLAAIELHVGPAPASDPDRPDELVIDLDPPKGAEVAQVRRATRRCRDLLVELGVSPRLKTSGSSGFHVHVLLEGGGTQDLARGVARGIATVLAGRFPDELTTEHRIDRRRGRVFVDWLRNSPKQTFIAPYSVRARPTAPVATPMDFSELAGTDPRRWTIRSLRRRLAQRDDPWAGEPRRVDLHRVAADLSSALAEVA